MHGMAWHGTRGPLVGSSFHIPLPGLLDCSEVKETEKTSGASFILCDAFNVRFYAVESAPYGCLYHDLYSNDYTELGVITFV